MNINLKVLRLMTIDKKDWVVWKTKFMKILGELV